MLNFFFSLLYHGQAFKPKIKDRDLYRPNQKYPELIYNYFDDFA